VQHNSIIHVNEGERQTTI